MFMHSGLIENQEQLRTLPPIGQLYTKTPTPTMHENPKRLIGS